MLIPVSTFIRAMPEIGFILTGVEPYFLLFERGDVQIFIYYRDPEGDIETSFALEDVGTWSQLVRDELLAKLRELVDLDD
ncbi:MAG: hypothetical protein L0177_20510 [Chloroflexi bacterium]|nr:hypothetical protein [Chloroflexota bacterium]